MSYSIGPIGATGPTGSLGAMGPGVTGLPAARTGTGLDSPLWVANWSTNTWVQVILLVFATFLAMT